MSVGGEVAYVGLGPLVGRSVAQPGTPYDGRGVWDLGQITLGDKKISQSASVGDGLVRHR